MIKSDFRRALEPKTTGAELDREGTGLKARIDAPHRVDGLLSQSGADPAAESAAAARSAAEPPAADEPAAQQLRLQAFQLAAHLRDRQKELDVREAELNSRLARWETEARAVRLSLADREAEVAGGAASLAEERGEFQPRSQLLAARESQVSSRETQLSQRETAVEEREHGISEREREIGRRLARLAAVEAAQQRGKPAAAVRAAENPANLHERLAQEYRHALAGLAQEREQVRQRAEHLHQCRLALAVTRDELAQVHQDTLEMRLAMEELWAQLSGTAPPAALIQSLGQIRAKLAEQSRQAQAELHEQRAELERIGGDLAGQYQKLAERKEQFETWAAGRAEVCRQEAARLLAREEQLGRRAALHREQSQRWAAEKLRYQHELRRIEAELRACQEAAANTAAPEEEEVLT